MLIGLELGDGSLPMPDSKDRGLLTETSNWLRKSPFHGSSESYFSPRYTNIGQWFPGINISLLFNCCLILVSRQRHEFETRNGNESIRELTLDLPN